ncbi:MAG TPA: hypothetical protein VFJ13_07890, partial [Paracoccaceae bacterium]|nr:hypothetical protein [Paracoccaceae bacterium]
GTLRLMGAVDPFLPEIPVDPGHLARVRREAVDSLDRSDPQEESFGFDPVSVAPPPQDPVAGERGI